MATRSGAKLLTAAWRRRTRKAWRCAARIIDNRYRALVISNVWKMLNESDDKRKAKMTNDKLMFNDNAPRNGMAANVMTSQRSLCRTSLFALASSPLRNVS